MIERGAEEILEKLLKLALGSDKEGEVIAAAHAIRRTMDGAGSDIHELAARLNAESSLGQRCSKSTTSSKTERTGCGRSWIQGR